MLKASARCNNEHAFYYFAMQCSLRIKTMKHLVVEANNTIKEPLMKSLTLIELALEVMHFVIEMLMCMQNLLKLQIKVMLR